MFGELTPRELLERIDRLRAEFRQHAWRHDAQSAPDPLNLTTSSHAQSHADTDHTAGWGTPTGAVDIGDSAAAGSATTHSHSDHQHAHAAPAGGYPQDTAASEADGTATTPARSDHVHKLHDHDHTGDAGDGAKISHDSALDGVSADDHHAQAHKDEHDPQDGADALDAAAASEIAGVQAAAEGSAHEFARADHAHQIQHAITDNHLATVDGSPSDDEYARWTADGLEGVNLTDYSIALGLSALTVDDANFGLNILSSMAYLALDSGDGYRYTRAQSPANTHQWIIATAVAASLDATSLKVDQIDEQTGGVGVTIDSVLLKDGVVAVGDVAFDDGTSDPLIDGAAAADGTENSVARKDHVHPLHHAEAHGPSKHTEGTGWRLTYLDASGDETEIALGAAGTLLRSAGAAAAPAFTAIYSLVDYVFTPDAELGADVATGDQQGVVLHSGDANETVVAIFTDAETAPTGAAMLLEIEFGNTDDLDTVASWTRIDQVSHTAGAKSIKDSSPAQGTITANRLLRLNVDQVGSGAAGQNVTVTMRVKRPLTT